MVLELRREPSYSCPPLPERPFLGRHFLQPGQVDALLQHSVKQCAAGDVLYLGAAQGVRGKARGPIRRQLRHAALPDEAALLFPRRVEAQLVEEAAVEGGVDVVDEVGRWKTGDGASIRVSVESLGIL
jgi:hypothetical protein